MTKPPMLIPTLGADEMSRMSGPISRRRCLRVGVGVVALSATGDARSTVIQPSDGPDPGSEGLIAGIDREVIFPGRQGGTTWFHPAPAWSPPPMARWP